MRLIVINQFDSTNIKYQYIIFIQFYATELNLTECFV